MKTSKWLLIVALVLIVVLLAGCKGHLNPSFIPTTAVTTCKCTSSPVPTVTPVPTPDPMTDEQRRIDLYVAAMKGVNEYSKRGQDFIAVRLDTLEGLSPESKNIVMSGLKSSQAQGNILVYELYKTNQMLFDDLGQPIRGTVLSIKLIEYNGITAKIEAISFFGVVGADYATYDAIYENGVWTLKQVGWGVS